MSLAQVLHIQVKRTLKIFFFFLINNELKVNIYYSYLLINTNIIWMFKN